MNRKRISAFLFVLLAILLTPYAAKADMVYKFIKMTCDPVAQSTTIQAFYDQNESGKKRVAAHQRDVYYLNEIGSSEPRQYGDHIVCDLGDNQIVAFAAHKGDLPKGDSLKLFLNRGEVNESYTLDDQWTMSVQLTGPKSFDIKFCPDRLTSLHTIGSDKKRELMEQHKKICELMIVHENKLIVDYHAINPEAGK